MMTIEAQLAAQAMAEGAKWVRVSMGSTANRRVVLVGVAGLSTAQTTGLVNSLTSGLTGLLGSLLGTSKQVQVTVQTSTSPTP